MVASPIKKSAAEVFVVLVTVAKQEEAVRIGEGVVKAKLAACASIVPGIQSIYRWKGKVIKSQEFLLILKSSKARYSELETAIKAMHTYETPEIIALPVKQGLDRYLRWVQT